MRFAQVHDLIEEEARRGLMVHPVLQSYEGGLGVISGELKELAGAVMGDVARRDDEAIKKEALHVAASAFLFLADLCG